MRRNKKSTENQLKVEDSTSDSGEYLLLKPLIVAGEKHEAGKKISLTPHQAEFARDQSCIE